MSTYIFSVAREIVRDPREILERLTAFLRGLYYICYYRITRRNVRIGFPFSAFAPVNIVGPGVVTIGKRCYAAKNVFKGWTIVTHSSEASVTIGDRCVMGGITIRALQHVEIGEKTMSANSLIQDYLWMDHRRVRVQTGDTALLDVKPVVIGENVWLGAQCTVACGSRIGRDSVLSAGAWCYNMQVDDYCLVSGNPAKKPLPIEKLLKLKGDI
jgi:acetyltransferase-like isoleucine patch superfamily enzyme